MDKYDFVIISVTCFIAGLMIGIILGRDMQMNSDNNLLKRLGIEIIETRVFNGEEPEYSYRTVEPIKKEESK